MIFQNQILGFVRRPFFRFSLLTAVCSVGVLTTGCGQKGPLFLPVAPAVQNAPSAEIGLKPATNSTSPSSAAR
jgi:predicted small lipoprotein YifL